MGREFYIVFGPLSATKFGGHCPWRREAMAKPDLQAEVERLRGWLALIRDAGCPGIGCSEAAGFALDGEAVPLRGESTGAYNRRLAIDSGEKERDAKKKK